MRTRLLTTFFCAVATLCGLAVMSPPTAASAGPRCSDVTVLFARGTNEIGAPIGVTGLTFTTALSVLLPGKSVEPIGVNYPASVGFINRFQFARTVLAGARSMARAADQLAVACPRTRIVLGGYSQGAMVTAYAVNPALPAPTPSGRLSAPTLASIAPQTVSHVAAIVMFAPPSSQYLRSAGGPEMVVGRGYQGRTFVYCAPGDNVCNGAQFRMPDIVHVLYAIDGATAQAAVGTADLINDVS